MHKSPVFHYRFAQNLSNILKMSVKRNCEMTTFILSDAINIISEIISCPLALVHSKKCGCSKFLKVFPFSIATSALAVVIANSRQHRHVKGATLERQTDYT